MGEMHVPRLQRCCGCINLRPIARIEGTRKFCKACADERERLQCKTYHDPSVIQPYQQVRSPAEDIPTATAFSQPKGKRMPKPKKTDAEIRAAIQDALTELSAAGQHFTLKQLADRAGIANSTLFLKKHADLKAQAMEAIATIKAQAKAQAADPTFTALTEELETLRQRNRELRQQLSQVQPQGQVQVVEVFMPTTWLEQQAQAWRDTVADFERELEQVQKDLEAARVNLAATERLLELHQVEKPVTAEGLQMVFGNHSNGKGAIACGGEP